MDDTQELPKFWLSYSYGAITLYGISFQRTSDSQTRIKGVLQHHISFLLRERIQFALCRFLSLIITASQLISFPAGTKMFQSPAFPLLTEWHKARIPIRTSPDLSLRAAPRGLSQLATSFIGA